MKKHPKQDVEMWYKNKGFRCGVFVQKLSRNCPKIVQKLLIFEELIVSQGSVEKASKARRKNVGFGTNSKFVQEIVFLFENCTKILILFEICTKIATRIVSLFENYTKQCKFVHKLYKRIL